MFASKEAEEEVKRESAKTFVPGEIPSTEDVAKEEQAPKPAAPTPEQILAIKVSAYSFIFIILPTVLVSTLKAIY